uniref:NADH-ubiquinone oxidoreductase chain 2 n=1 Tax=Phacomorphus fratyi TaxID=723369 RepID=A0A0S2M7Z8_9COLE|nr:NADH dehydrogenase subunit 2 [Phacomorphus fratyi]ALO70820.1 NADH deshydrogenase subunit 2 [Phacomorphus fratyi]
MNKIYKMLFSTTLITSVIITISSFSWMGMWIGLEMNLLSIIPMMNNKMNLFSSETSVKYLIVQALASSILLMSIILFSMNWHNLSSTLMFNSSLLMKMGAAPFHYWFPEILEGLSWMNSLIMMTIQKIAPMIIFIMNSVLFTSIIILMSMLISGVLGINQTSMRKLLAYSSINHISWMLASLMYMKSLWLIYFSIYSIISLNMVIFLNKFKIFYLKHLTSFSKNSMMKFFLMMNLFSLGGLPPFLGFFPKWIIIQILITNNSFTMSFLMIMMTLIVLFFYMRITLNSLMMINTQINFKLNTNHNTYWMIFFNSLSINSLIFYTLMINLL